MPIPVEIINGKKTVTVLGMPLLYLPFVHSRDLFLAQGKAQLRGP
jgi:hypothetical protein